MKTIIGGEIKGLSEMMEEARSLVVEQMVEEAKKYVNAIVNIHS